jgi:hypothetical protein
VYSFDAQGDDILEHRNHYLERRDDFDTQEDDVLEKFIIFSTISIVFLSVEMTSILKKMTFLSVEMASILKKMTFLSVKMASMLKKMTFLSVKTVFFSK